MIYYFINLKNGFNFRSKIKNMNYLTSNYHTLIWFWFIVYTVTIIFLFPNKSHSKVGEPIFKDDNEEALQLASKILLRTVLVIPLLFLLKNSV